MRQQFSQRQGRLRAVRRHGTVEAHSVEQGLDVATVTADAFAAILRIE